MFVLLVRIFLKDTNLSSLLEKVSQDFVELFTQQRNKIILYYHNKGSSTFCECNLKKEVDFIRILFRRM